MHNYWAFGLAINSDFPLPGFALAEGGNDISIRLSSADQIPLETRGKLAYLKISPQEAILADDSVGTFVINGGTEILVIPQPDVDSHLVQTYLQGTVLAVLLYQRGLFVLHASVVEIDGEAIALVGTSGTGKSSLAAALYSRGHRIVSDDVCPLKIDDHSIKVFPGYPNLKISFEAAKTLGIDPGSLVLLDDDEDKRGFRARQGFIKDSIPLRQVYILQQGSGNGIQSVKPQEAVIEFVRNSIPTRFLQPEDKSHFLNCVQLAQRLPVFRLNFPISIQTLPEQARRIEEHLLSRDEKPSGMHTPTHEIKQ